MQRLVLMGWREGVDERRISTARLLRREVGMNLAESKAAIDELVETGRLLVSVPTEEVMSRFMHAADDLGLICEREECHGG